MKKKIGIIILSIFTFSLFLGISIYAYVKNQAGSLDLNNVSSIAEDNIIEVASFYDLLSYGTDSSYNSKESVSSDRAILRFKNDITLTSDLVLTKDIQIDLNTHTLDLNNYTLTFKSGYSGTSGIYNGTIESGIVTDGESKGAIVIDLIKSGFKEEDVSYKKNNVKAAPTDIFTIVHLDKKYSAYSALYMVGKALNSSLNQAPKFEDYHTVSSNNFELTIDKFIPSMACEIKGTTEYCSYVYKDLDLPYYYLSSDINISYKSSDENIVSNYGKISTSTLNDHSDVTLKVIISVSSAGVTTDYDLDFKLHVVKLTDANTKKLVSKSLIKSYISPYYKKEALTIMENVVFSDYYYGFDHAIELPKSAFGGLITYTYSVTDYDGNDVDGRLADKSNTVYFEPNLNCYHLVINDESLNMYSTYVSTKESIAHLILNHLYGGAIIYDKTYQNLPLETVSTIQNGDNTVVKNLITEHGVTQINYAIKESSIAETYYQINDNVLSINNNVVPIDKAPYITVSFTFSDGTRVDIDVYVDYLDSTGSILSSFLSYYSIYDPEVPSELLTKFDMPFAYNDSTTDTPHLIPPYIVYDVATYTIEEETLADGSTFTYYNYHYFKPKNLKIDLYYNGQVRYTFPEYTNQNSFSNQLDAHLGTKKLSEIASYSDAHYIFSIDAQESLTENQRLILMYNYKFNENDASWTPYAKVVGNTTYFTDLNTTQFTVLGGLFYNEQGMNGSGAPVDHAVKDQTFFKWIYNKFRPSQIEELKNINQNNTIIPMDWLSQDILISSSDTALSSVHDYSGIGYLKNVTKVDLSNSKSVSNSVIIGLAGMPSLHTLILKNCNITDISALSKLTTVKVLDISNNKISYFDALSEVTSLEKVYLYNNVPENGDIKYVGSTGICNFQAFYDLMRHGSAVYNTVSNNIPVLYAESNSIDDYRRLKSICYQDKLKLGKDISALYKPFASLGLDITNVTGDARPGNNPFGLQTSGELSWSHEEDKTAETATYFYVKLTYSTGYILTVKYYVDRYE